jgi:MYXO-CTERM domain-containing protein
VCANATSCKTSCSTSTDCTTSACSAGSCEIGAVVDATPADAAGSDASTADTASIDSGIDSGTTVDSIASDTELADTSTEDSTVPDSAPLDSSALDTAIAIDSATAADTAEEEVNVAAPHSDGGKPILPASIQRCTRDEECATGHCADGVCCDTACGDRCYSCAQLDSPGTCKIRPPGVDLRGECGPIGTCVATCDGKGSCVGAGNGTQCAQQRCTGKAKGVGPAYCAGRGAACPVGEGVPFECGPYVCEPLFGACTTTCTKSTECAVGHVCDVASKQCVPVPAPAEDDGGCTTSARPTHGHAGFALVALLFALSKRRRARL